MRRAEAGFTLIELLAVLALLGVAAAIIWPSPPSAGAAALRAETSSLVAALVEARDRARREGAVRCVSLTVRAEGCAVPISGGRGARDVSVSVAGAEPVRFHPDGSASAATVRLVAGALSREVRIIGSTGQVLAR